MHSTCSVYVGVPFSSFGICHLPSVLLPMVPSSLHIWPRFLSLWSHIQSHLTSVVQAQRCTFPRLQMLSHTTCRRDSWTLNICNIALVVLIPEHNKPLASGESAIVSNRSIVLARSIATNPEPM